MIDTNPILETGQSFCAVVMSVYNFRQTQNKEANMIKRIVLAGVLSALIAGPALASSCPLMVKEIDAALETNTTLSEEQVAEVKTLRDQGEAEHNAGNHAESVATLQKAKDILGLK